MGFANQRGKVGYHAMTLGNFEGAMPPIPVQGKRKISPFFIYMKHRKTQMIAAGQTDLNMKEILPIIAQEWHALPEEAKQYFRDESERDKMLDDQRLGLIPQTSFPQQISIRPGINPPMPPTRRAFNSYGEPFKKAMTPYMCFLKEQTALLSQTNSQVVMKDLVKYGAQKWNLMTDQEREPYQILAEVDKIRYERDKMAFEGANNPLRD